MRYNFDESINRQNNHSAKWEEMDKKFISNNLWPMWIADMDLKTAPEIIDAMRAKVEEGIFGYVYRPDSYYESAAKWSQRRFNYKIDPKTLINSPGVVPTLSILIRQLTKKQDSILIQSPVYYPFACVIKDNDRKLIENNLIQDEKGYYTIDFNDFENKIIKNNVKLFILCSPHNPIGRVWKKEELEKISNICLKHKVRVISDEIWRDIIMPGFSHIPTASLSKEIEKNTITCFSPTKTFNLAGLQSSFVAFPIENEWKNFDTELGILDIKRNNPFSLVAFETAYTKCDSWVDQLNLYLNDNMEYVINFLKENIPQIKTIKPEGTYLMWLDFSALNMSKEELSKFLQEKAKVALDDGFWFGENGIGFERINIACPRYMLEIGLHRIKEAVNNI
ncbi:MalY/PatB family protein [Cetobacterium sp.]|uniref:MalY/PatB family protein n=1 Tax=Cetobacterium sp. TaxID=2071632 RepID=UPI003AF05515